MAVMLSRTYDALIAAGAPEEKARAAAEEVANLHNRLTRIEVMSAITVTGVFALLTLLLWHISAGN